MKKVLALILTMLLLLQTVPVTVLAEEMISEQAEEAEVVSAEEIVPCTEVPPIQVSDEETECEPLTAEETTPAPTAGNEESIVCAEEPPIYDPQQAMTIELPVRVAASESDFTYTVTDGSATITGYTGTATELVIPDEIDGYPVTYIENGAFRGNTSITHVTLPETLQYIGSGSFSGCTGLLTLTLPDSVLMIFKSGFYGCTSLKEVYVGAGFECLDLDCFPGCTGLERIIVSEDNPYYQSIDGIVYSKDLAACCLCPEGKTGSITIPETVNMVMNYTFLNCAGVTEVRIPDSVTSIGMDAFSGCSGLTAVMIGNGVTSIGSYAFSECSGLTTVTIPESVTIIGNDAFSECSGLTTIYYNAEADLNPSSKSVFYGAGSSSVTGLSVVFGETVKSIPAYLFPGCTSLTSVTIPESVTSIGNYAFSGCSGLTTVTIPDSVTSIGRNAFDGCDGLTSITIPESVTSIGSYAFSGCSGLTTIYYNAEAILVSSNGSFFSEAGSSSVTGLSVVFGETVKSIPAYLFSGCTSLTSVTIPESVTIIGNDAFSECSGLTTVTIPESVTSIEDQAFFCCSNLTSVTIMNRTTFIAYSAFNYVSSEMEFCGIDCSTAAKYAKIYGFAFQAIGTAEHILDPNDEGLIEKKATCTREGMLKKTCTLCGETVRISIPATGHDYGEATWNWAEDFSTATVTYVCANDSQHIYTDEAMVTSVRVEPTPEEDGSITYTATAEDPAGNSVTDTKVTILPATGYTYEDPVYTWTATENGYDVTGLKKCRENAAKDITETVAASFSVKTAATCTEDGEGIWTATFTNTAFTTQTRPEVIPATGHTPGDAVHENEVAATCSREGSYDEVVYCTVCHEEMSRVKKTVAKQEHTVVKDAAVAPTCTEEGLTEGSHCSVCGAVIVAQETVPATGHDWGEPTWNWSSDNRTATATFRCANDSTHTRNENATVTTETTPATAGEVGKTVYTATVTFEGETYTDAAEVILPILDTTYTLTYDANGGDGAPVAQTVTNNTLSATFPVSSTVPVRRGYAFRGWARIDDAEQPTEGTTVTLNYPETELVLYAVWEVNVPAFKSQSLVLSGQIGLNFFLELPEVEGVDYSRSYMTFTIGQDKTEYRDDFDPDHMNGAHTRYGFTCYVNSIQMADTITATFHYGDGKTVSKEYSVLKYIEFFEDNISAFNAKTIALIRAIADFGHYEQIYLAYVNEWTIGESYTEMSKYYTESFDYDAILDAVAGKAIVKTLSGSKVSKATYKLHLDSTTTVDVLLTVPAGTALTASATFNGKTYKAVKQPDGRYMVQIPDIAAHQLGDMITVSGNAGGAFTVQVSALSYVRSVLANNLTVPEKNGLSALYQYYTAVLAYRK